MKSKIYINYDPTLRRIFKKTKGYLHNRDNRNEGPITIKKFLKKKKIILSNKVKSKVAIHFFDKGNIFRKINYLINNEIENIQLQNTYSFMKNNFDKVFTMLDDYVDNKKFFKMFEPNFFPKINKKQFFNKKRKFLCIICGNKYTKLNTKGDLYAYRYADIKYFEKKIPKRFDLYGIDWQSIKRENNFLNKIIFKIFQKLPHNSNLIHKSNKGRLKSKRSLKNYTFSICYENSSLHNGYITEKIFDSFFYGNIPIYLGAPNVTKYIPANCFIDRRNFKDCSSLLNYLEFMNEKTIDNYKINIFKFLKSNKAKRFAPINVAKLIYKNL